MHLPPSVSERSGRSQWPLATIVVFAALGAVLAGIAAGFSWPYMFALAAAFSLGAAALGFLTVFRR